MNTNSPTCADLSEEVHVERDGKEQLEMGDGEEQPSHLRDGAMELGQVQTAKPTPVTPATV